jgi:hypothetical protein
MILSRELRPFGLADDLEAMGEAVRDEDEDPAGVATSRV